MGNEKKFTGGTHKVTPITGDEAACHREMFAVVEENWGLIEDAATVINFVRMAPKIVASIVGIFGLAAAISFAAKLYGVGP